MNCWDYYNKETDTFDFENMPGVKETSEPYLGKSSFIDKCTDEYLKYGSVLNSLPDPASIGKLAVQLNIGIQAQLYNFSNFIDNCMFDCNNDSMGSFFLNSQDYEDYN